MYICHLLLHFPQKTHSIVAWKCSHELSAVTRGAEDEDEVPGVPMRLLQWTPQLRGRSQRMGHVFSFLFLFSSSGSRKHQRQTWVGSKCSLKKPTTLRNGRPNSSPWWRAKTKFGTRARIHFPGMGCLRQLQLSNDSVLNSSFLKLQSQTAGFWWRKTEEELF